MNTMNDLPAGTPGDHRPSSQPDPYSQYSSAPLSSEPLSSGPPRKRRMLRWGAGVTLAGLLAGGGIALAVVSGGSTPAAATSPGATGSGSGQAEGTTLNAELNAASSTAAGSLPRVRAALARLRALGGVEGEFTVHNSTGFHTVAFERGTVQSVNSADVVVKSADGTTATWLIVSDTVVRKGGAKTTASSLAVGQPVFVGGPVVSGNKDARLIVIKPDSSGSSGSSGSSSSGVSGSSSVSGSASGTSLS
jgi:hypothetical protein